MNRASQHRGAGRVADLTEQAGGPPLNPIEMGVPGRATAVVRLFENVSYQVA